MADGNPFANMLRQLVGRNSASDYVDVLQSRSTDAARRLLEDLLEQNTGSMAIKPEWKKTESGQRFGQLGAEEQRAFLFAAVGMAVQEKSERQAGRLGSLPWYSRVHT